MQRRFTYILRRYAVSEVIFSYQPNGKQALAQDQRIALEQLLWSCDGLKEVKVANYDGDTPRENRKGATPVSFLRY